jgi:hypothetical protein
MTKSSLVSLKSHFSDLHDPRAPHNIEHLLIDILLITICAVICGAESWVDIENYGLAKDSWLRTFLECFLNWVQSVFEITDGQVIAIDGKTLRGSFERGCKRAMIHMVSAWATHNHIVLGQRKVDEKSNEITAIPELLEVLALAGAIVTIDVMGCQTEIAKQITDQGGDYVLALKGNQGNLHKDVIQQFEQAQQQEFRGIEQGATFI